MLVMNRKDDFKVGVFLKEGRFEVLIKVWIKSFEWTNDRDSWNTFGGKRGKWGTWAYGVFGSTKRGYNVSKSAIGYAHVVDRLKAHSRSCPAQENDYPEPKVPPKRNDEEEGLGKYSCQDPSVYPTALR